ncbi:MAG: membrane protein insertase YidC [Acetobacteraceae bacterium]
MDQKRLIIAIAISIAILLGFQFLIPKAPPRPVQEAASSLGQPANPDAPRAAGTPAPTGGAESVPQPKDVPRLQISAARVSGSVSLRGALLDDLVLRDYHEEVSNTSPLVRVLAPQYDPAAELRAVRLDLGYAGREAAGRGDDLDHLGAGADSGRPGDAELGQRRRAGVLHQALH